MRCLAATLAGTAKLQIWLLELGALHSGLVDLLAVVWQSDGEIPVRLLLLDNVCSWLQRQCVSGADSNAEFTAGAVPR